MKEYYFKFKSLDNMNYYRAKIQYDGTSYYGFQWQKDIPTIQDDLNKAIKCIVAGKVTTMGASRTDSGVHAMEQVVKITSEQEIDCSTFLKLANSILTPQIRFLDIISCAGDFRPASDHLSKEYRYYFTNEKVITIKDRRFISNFSKPLDLNSISTCVNSLVGTHSFHNFCSAGSNVKSTTRTILTSELKEINPQIIFSQADLFMMPKDLKSCYQLKIEGNGFLKQMIRHIVSALWMVGSGKLTTEDFSILLNGPKKNTRMWKVAHPNGLFLCQVKYPEQNDYKKTQAHHS